METAKKHLETGLKLLDSVEFRLKGEDITRVAMARQEFQNAFATLVKAQKTTEVKTNG